MRTDNSGKFEGQNLTRYIFECTMSVLYLVFALILLFTNLFSNVVNGTVRLCLGILLAIYGIFRIGRVLKKLFEKNKE